MGCARGAVFCVDDDRMHGILGRARDLPRVFTETVVDTSARLTDVLRSARERDLVHFLSRAGAEALGVFFCAGGRRFRIVDALAHSTQFEFAGEKNPGVEFACKRIQTMGCVVHVGNACRAGGERSEEGIAGLAPGLCNQLLDVVFNEVRGVTRPLNTV